LHARKEARSGIEKGKVKKKYGEKMAIAVWPRAPR
jgi:hypothetical protein